MRLVCLGSFLPDWLLQDPLFSNITHSYSLECQDISFATFKCVDFILQTRLDSVTIAHFSDASSSKRCIVGVYHSTIPMSLFPSSDRITDSATSH